MKGYHGRKLTKKGTGGKIRKHKDKKLAKKGGHFSSTKAAENDVREAVVVRGGTEKVVSLYASTVNVVMDDKSIKKTKILGVVESPNNRHYARMNILTKGIVIKTEFGNARITNRPGQEGQVNAVLLKE